jgi:periplasmic protein TonB
MFEESLIESTRPSRRSGRGISLPLSVALHVLIIGAAIGASFWFEEDTIEPPVPVIFYPPGSPPPSSGASHRTDSVPRRPEKRTAPTFPSIAILKSAPSVTPENDTEPVRDSDVLVPGEDSGDATGIKGGTGDNKDGQPGAGRRVETIHVGGDVRPPLLIERVEPVYPETDRKLHKEGIVILEAIITSDGAVDEVEVLKSADPLLDEAARRAVIRWRYRPATLNGRAVRVYLTVTVSFRLH